jgi:CxxC-x17-CxxC domain-containing protein
VPAFTGQDASPILPRSLAVARSRRQDDIGTIQPAVIVSRYYWPNGISLYHIEFTVPDTITEIECANCGTFFLLSQAERTFRREHGMSRPELCPECRSERRATRHAQSVANYEQERSENRTSYRVKKLTVPANRMYNATCDQCGGPARVPFVPSGDRPVYCRDCFNARRGR